MNLKAILRTSKLFLENNSSTILTVSSVTGVIFTVVTASKATIHAQAILADEAEIRAEETDCYYIPTEDKIRLTWKCYIPTAISATLTIGAIIGSHVCSAKQAEALSSAYMLSQATLQEYQKKVVERIGERKEKDIYQEAVREVAEKNSPVAALIDGGGFDVIDTGHGNTLFYDVPGDRYFKSDINYLKTKVNDMNREVRTEMYFDWNEICYRWGLPYKKYGSDLIFDVDRPLELMLVPELMENGQVRILVDYDLYPKVLER